jgi:endonuclease/exonuclease/phosphatase family metal-dependent hydrolase
VVNAAQHLRLGSFNLLSGRSLSDGSIVRQRLVDAVTELDADILAVQEVDRLQPRSGGLDQAACIAETMGAVSSRFVATVEGTPGEPGWTAADWAPAVPRPELPGYGVALISRLPVVEWHVLPLRPARGRFPLVIPTSPPRFLWLPDEPRAAVAAVLEHPRMTIACTHLSFSPTANVRQLLSVRRWLSNLPSPRVLMGDLNLPGAAVRRITGWTPLVSAPTFPSPAPRIQLDHVLAAELPNGSRACGRVRRMPISDHRAVLVELDLPVR